MSTSGSAGFGMAAMSAFSLPGPRRESAPAGAPEPRGVRALVAGIEAILDPSGALYWPEMDTLVVSDLHLETGSSYARSGQMLPPYDTAITLDRLVDVVCRYSPERIISLGDAFHDPFGPERLSARARATLMALCEVAEMIWITGNHDHAAAEAIGGHAVERLTLGSVTFRHIPTAGQPASAEIAGHLHPAARIVVRGRPLKRRAFVSCERRLVMPAFGCLTGGLPVSDAAFAPLWPDGPAAVHLIARHGVYRV